MQLHRHMAVAQVISRLQQLQRAGRFHPQQILGGRNDLHLQGPGRIGQPVTRLQRSVARQLQQHVAAAGGLTTAPQHRALFRRQWQLQRLIGIKRRRIPFGTTPLQHDQGVAHRHSSAQNESLPRSGASFGSPCYQVWGGGGRA